MLFFCLAGGAGLEPATKKLTASRSTSELPANISISIAQTKGRRQVPEGFHTWAKREGHFGGPLLTLSALDVRERPRLDRDGLRITEPRRHDAGVRAGLYGSWLNGEGVGKDLNGLDLHASLFRRLFVSMDTIAKFFRRVKS